MLFRTRITEAIEQGQYSQKKIAELLGIAESNITNWKKGENLPSVDILYKLCILLDESADYLLGLEDIDGRRIDNRTFQFNNINNISIK